MAHRECRQALYADMGLQWGQPLSVGYEVDEVLQWVDLGISREDPLQLVEEVEVEMAPELKFKGEVIT